jgi:hypothetical protein
MHSRAWRLAAAAAFVATFAVCASTAIHYRPRDWRSAGTGRWVTTIEGVDLETRGAGGRGRTLSAELTIHNTSLAPVVVAGARLSTANGSIESASAPEADAAARTVEGGQTRRVAWEFELPASGAGAGEPVTLFVSLRLGGQDREIAVPLVPD